MRNKPPDGFPVRSTPFPNDLIDFALPRLSDTEWRVMCVVIRQTFGWQDQHGSRKKTEWLSQRLLKQKTGRESGAISRAIANLVKLGLLRVIDARGALMKSSADRRRSRSRLWFSANLGEVHRWRVSVTQKRSSLLEHNKRKREKRKEHRLKAPRGRSAPLSHG